MEVSADHTEFEVFSHNLIWLRRKHGYSKRRMAKILGIGIWSLNKLERGEMPPRLGINIFIAVHDHFGIRPSYQLTQWLE